jgi:hypothetical protein
MKAVCVILSFLIAAPAVAADLIFQKTKLVHATGEGEKEIGAVVAWGDDQVKITLKSKLDRKKYPDVEFSIPYSSMSNLEYSNSKHWRVAAALLVSPLTLFSKRKHHYFSFTYIKKNEKKDAIILRIDKKEERTYRTRVPLITGLELKEIKEE